MLIFPLISYRKGSFVPPPTGYFWHVKKGTLDLSVFNRSSVMSMTTKCVLAALAVVATFGVANAQYTTREGDYRYQDGYSGYGSQYGGPYGPSQYGPPPSYYAPRSYYGPQTTPEGDYRSYGPPPSYYGNRGYYGPRTTPEGDYYR